MSVTLVALRFRALSGSAVFAAAAGFCSITVAGIPTGYTIEALLPPGAPHSVSVRALYDDGTIGIEVSNGSHNSIGNVQAWVRLPDGTWFQAIMPPGNNPINQLGAVGPDGTMYGTWRFNNNIFDQRGFIFTPDGEFTDLGQFLNAAGNPSNTFFNTATADYAACRTANVGYVYRTKDEKVIQIPTIQGPDGLATAFGSNPANQFVGISPSGEGSRATLWQKDANGEFQAHNMGLPPDPHPDATSTARGVNSHTVAVGYTGTFTDNDAFIWNEADGMSILPRLDPDRSHFAYDIDDDGIVVGYRATSGSQIGAVIWDSNTGEGFDLLPLVKDAQQWHLLDARYINSSGQIAGRGVLNGLHTMYLLTPVSTGIPGDLTGNGSVGVPDLLILLANWGPCPDPSDCLADLTGDGSVGVPDLLILLANWG